MEKVVILARVSTDKQDYQRQIVELTDYCSKVGWEIVKVFANKVSGAKKTEERPEILEMLSYVKEHNMTPDEMINDLTGLEKAIYKKVFAGSFSKKMYRMYEYKG